MPLIDYEREVFAECGAWINFHHLEESLSLDELMELYDATVQRENRMMRMLAAAVGAEIPDNEEEPRRDRGNNKDEKLLPAYAVDPNKGGRAKDLTTEEDIASLPIGLGYGIIGPEDV